MLQVPDVFAAKARAHGVDDWIDELPDLVGRIAGEWSLTVGEVLDGGTEALVVAVRRRDDSPAVLKLLVPGRGPAALAEIQALQLDAGRGCAALYSADLAVGALLIERLGPSMHDLGVPIAKRGVVALGDAELELLNDSGHDTHREVDQEQLAEELRETEVGLVAVTVPAGVVAGDHHRQAPRQRDHGEVVHGGDPELPSGKHECVHESRAAHTRAPRRAGHRSICDRSHEST